MGLGVHIGQRRKGFSIILAGFLLLGLVSLRTPLQAQELNAQVEILSPQLPHTNKRVLDVLQRIMSDFLNNRSWTGQAVMPQERINCSFVITVNAWDGMSEFTAQAQIVSMRPVYNTNYASPVLNMTDVDFNFSYTEGEIMDYSDQQFSNNLTSLLAFYAYVIIGMDADTFSPEGGTPFFTKAQAVVNNAQNTSYSGWRFMDSDANRYWLVANLHDRRFLPLRQFSYVYSRLGLDMLAESPDAARKQIVEALESLRSVDRMASGSVLDQLIFTAKSSEFVGVLSGLNPQQRLQAYNFLTEIDPSNDQKYQALRSR